MILLHPTITLRERKLAKHTSSIITRYSIKHFLSFRPLNFPHFKNLRSDLEHKLKGDTKKLLVGLVLDEGEFFAEALRDQVEDSFRFSALIS